MPSTEVWTIGRLLEWTTDYLRRHGADSPRLDAEVLLAHARACQRIDLYASFAESPAEAILTSFRQMVRQRAEGTPVAYLVGYREFFSLPFRVTPDVLIPRPETEFLVVRMLEALAGLEQREGGTRVADVGTGSGVIAICAAKRFANCRVTAIDVSAAALDVARANAERHGVAGQIEWVQSDLFDAAPPGGQFDVVASNPPYVADHELADVSQDVRKFEPRVALVAGERGTEIAERLVPQAAERLRAGGWLLMEINSRLEAETRALVERDPRLDAGPTIRDLAGLPRVVQARRK